MKINGNTKIIGNTCILVPYKKEHVPQYHKWMKDPWIREMTASEELTLDEEYENQESWYTDEKKLTFIILDTTIPIEGGFAMAGDVNIFLNNEDDPLEGEIEIMIAEERSRKKGIAREALKLMMKYANEFISTKTFVSKIGEDNAASRSLFSSLNYKQIGEANYFKEVRYEFVLDSSSSELQKELDYVKITTYE